MQTDTPTLMLDGYPVTLDRAADLAARGYASIEIEIYEPDPEKPGYLRHVRRRTPTEVYRDLRTVLGEYPVGGEEYFNGPTDRSCVNCRKNQPGRTCFASSHGQYSNGPCRLHAECTGYQSIGDAPFPEGRLAVFAVRGGSEGDYVHVEVDGQCLMLAKTFQGRDAAWLCARHIADLLGV